MAKNLALTQSPEILFVANKRIAGGLRGQAAGRKVLAPGGSCNEGAATGRFPRATGTRRDARLEAATRGARARGSKRGSPARVFGGSEVGDST